MSIKEFIQQWIIRAGITPMPGCRIRIDNSLYSLEGEYLGQIEYED